MNYYKNIQISYKHVLQVYLSYNTYTKYKKCADKIFDKVYANVLR